MHLWFSKEGKKVRNIGFKHKLKMTVMQKPANPFTKSTRHFRSNDTPITLINNILIQINAKYLDFYVQLTSIICFSSLILNIY